MCKIQMEIRDYIEGLARGADNGNQKANLEENLVIRKTDLQYMDSALEVLKLEEPPKRLRKVKSDPGYSISDFGLIKKPSRRK